MAARGVDGVEATSPDIAWNEAGELVKAHGKAMRFRQDADRLRAQVAGRA